MGTYPRFKWPRATGDDRLFAVSNREPYEHVRENFLVTGNLKRYLTLFLHETEG